MLSCVTAYRKLPRAVRHIHFMPRITALYRRYKRSTVMYSATPTCDLGGGTSFQSNQIKLHVTKNISSDPKFLRCGSNAACTFVWYRAICHIGPTIYVLACRICPIRSTPAAIIYLKTEFAPTCQQQWLVFHGSLNF